ARYWLMRTFKTVARTRYCFCRTYFCLDVNCLFTYIKTHRAALYARRPVSTLLAQSHFLRRHFAENRPVIRLRIPSTSLPSGEKIPDATHATSGERIRRMFSHTPCR